MADRLGPPLKFWRSVIDEAEQERKRHEPWWQANLDAYRPTMTGTPTSYEEDINTNRDFTAVERKKPDMFYRRPDLTLKPSPATERPMPQIDPTTGQPMPQVDPNTQQPVVGPDGQPVPAMVSQLPALQTQQDILNELLDTDLKAVRMVHRTLFDLICTSGIGCTKFCYDAVFKTVPGDPLKGEPEQVDVPLHERIGWDHFSPKKVLIPADHRSSDPDDAPWLGWKATLPLTRTTRQQYQLPKSFRGSNETETEDHFEHGGARDERSLRKTFTVTELWYKSALYRDDIVHPEHLTHLVLVDGLDDPAIEEDSPDQTLDEMGQLTPDSVIGYPIHLLTTRDVTDSPYPPSDCTIARPLVNELNISRTQELHRRDANTTRWAYNKEVIDPKTLQQIVRSPIGGFIGLSAAAFHGESIKELPQSHAPRESLQTADRIDNDISRVFGVDATGAGVAEQGDPTATEVQNRQANASARFDYEREAVLDWYIRGVIKLSSYVQRYLPVSKAAEIVGTEAATVWDGWRRLVPARVAFTAMPDSALRVDQAVDRNQAQEFYTYVANDPYVSKGRKVLLEKLFRTFHINPAGIVNDPDPPSPQPTPLSFSASAEDLTGAAAPVLVAMLQQSGWQITPEQVQQMMGLLLQSQQLAQAQADEEAAATADTAHGGKVSPMETLDKHAADAGDGMQGIGGIRQGATGGGA